MNIITGEPYLEEKHLNGFDNYKYSSQDTSPYSVYVVNPCWNKMVEFVPRWVAPNLMTLVGFLLVLSTCLLLSWFDYDFKNAAGIPSWVWLYSSVAHITGYNLDGMDGKQARRTKTSTPLGELFDHGLDSVLTTTIPLATFSILGLGGQLELTEIMVFVITILGMFGFYITHWEKYNTGILFLPWIYDVIHQIISLGYLLTGVFGIGVWERLQDALSLIGVRIPLGPFYLTAMIGGTIISILFSVWNVIVAYTNNKNKRSRQLDALSPWVPFLAIVAAFSIWAYVSPAGILVLELRCFCTVMGIAFSNFTCHLIIAQMSGVRFRVYNSLVVLPYVCIVVSLLLPQLEVTALYAYFMFALTSHLHFGYSVVKQLTSHFKIDCFRIPYERKNS